MRRLLGIVVFALVAALSASSAQAPAQRIALVIGNGAYQRPAWVLTNPPRDADLIAQRLAALGFQVDLVKNADREAMQNAFTRFGQRLRAGGKSAEGVFYYAGHGAQQDGVNYLVPVDASARTADQLRFQAPAMQFLLDDMAAAGNAVNLIILDACRDMPLEQGFRSGGGGLADTGKLPNVLVAYAAAPGRTASDGGGANSPFTATLANYLATEPGETIGQLFADVNAAVYSSTGGAQSPEYRNGLVRAPRWSFASTRTPAPAVAAPAPAQIASVARTTAIAPPAVSPPPEAKEFRDCPDCPQMVRLPGGSFQMGDLQGNGEADEKPAHWVKLAPFAAGKFEITFAEWEACARDGGCSGYSPPDQGWGRGNRPVINVSWEDAKRYVQWINGKVPGAPYRLLTEAEWEYAARGGKDNAYWWGDVADHGYANYGKDQCCDGLASGRDQWVNTAPVGSFPANAFGLYDMHGNVWEWVEDCYNANYNGAPTDGSAITTGSCSVRVARGGSWGNHPADLRSADRGRDTPAYRLSNLGFRVARTY